MGDTKEMSEARKRGKGGQGARQGGGRERERDAARDLVHVVCAEYCIAVITRLSFGRGVAVFYLIYASV